MFNPAPMSIFNPISLLMVLVNLPKMAKIGYKLRIQWRWRPKFIKKVYSFDMYAYYTAVVPEKWNTWLIQPYMLYHSKIKNRIDYYQISEWEVVTKDLDCIMTEYECTKLLEDINDFNRYHGIRKLDEMELFGSWTSEMRDMMITKNVCTDFKSTDFYFG